MQLKRSNTMKRASEFAMVRNAGRSEAGRFLILSTAPMAQATATSRFGIITTKRIGHAVVRNLLRRRVREILRAHGAPLALGLHVVIVVRNRAALVSYTDLEKDFLKLLARCRKYTSPPPCSNA
mgnify:CR=1 FL=1